MPVFVKELLDLKGRNVVTVRPDMSLGDAAITLNEHRIGAVVVTDEKGAILGIFTERDMVKAIATQASDALKSPVSTVMTKNVTRCHEGSTSDDVMELMTGGRFRHVPVEAHGQLVGIISIGDVVKARMSEIEAEAEHIKAYIAG